MAGLANLEWQPTLALFHFMCACVYAQHLQCACGMCCWRALLWACVCAHNTPWPIAVVVAFCPTTNGIGSWSGMHVHANLSMSSACLIPALT
jgi:hypothetical protein